MLMTLQPMQYEQLLMDAVDKNCRVVITYKCQDGWRLHKGTFGERDRKPESYTIQLVPGCEDQGRNMPCVGESVSITFRHGRKKCMFTSSLLRIVDSPEPGVWTLSWPKEVRQLQRRAYERVSPPEGTVLAVRFWQQDDDNESGGRENARHGQLENISAGGMRVRTGDLKNIELDKTYRCVFTPADSNQAIVLDARLRHRESALDGRASLGFQFIGLEASDEGRKTLARLAKVVGKLHRARRPRKKSAD
jgi:c-di-GMP-binding flagellar brake protein YcgR